MARQSFLIVLFCLILCAGPAAAQQWRISDEAPARAGFAESGRLSRFWIACRAPGGEIDVVIAALSPAVETGLAYSAVATIGDMAFILPAKAEADRRTGGHVLVHATSLSDLAAFIDALKAGASLTVETPMEVMTVPLDGSAAALGAFEERCVE